MIRSILTVSLILLFVSCKKEFDHEAYLETKVQEKIAHHLKKELVKCQIKAEEDAQKHIDSLINQWISEDLLDTIKFPGKPTKPGIPDHIIENWQDPKTKLLSDSIQ